MNTLYTPGPWRLGHKVPNLIVQDTPDKCGVVICEVDPEEKPFAQTHANRLLIASAPDLYEALKEAYEDLLIWANETPGFRFDDPTCSTNQALAKARLALNKARGDAVDVAQENPATASTTQATEVSK